MLFKFKSFIIIEIWLTMLLLFSHSVVSNSLQPYGLQHTRLPFPSLSPRICSNSCHWVSDAIESSHPLSPPFLLPSIFPSIRMFSKESDLCIRWSFSFSISSSNEYSELISFRIDWFDLAVQETPQASSPIPQLKSINSSAFNLLYGPSLTSIHGY